MATGWRLTIVVMCALSAFSSTLADIYRWDTGKVILGTERIELEPGLDLSSRSHWDPEVGQINDGPWNTNEQNLNYANLSGGLDLRESTFRSSWLNGADFSGADLTGVNLSEAMLTNVNL